MTDGLNTILEQGGAFEYLYKSADPLFDDLVKAINIVRGFIETNNLIIYGGTAIDMALRLKGDHIYSEEMLRIPDLDFYSPIHVEHSCALADELYDAGFVDARVITALHPTTMRVDIGDNHFIADVGYVPHAIFNRIPILTYNNLRIVTPTFQRMDIHLSLSFPFDGAPRENIFGRWKKDIKRFNILDRHYPVETTGAALATYPVKMSKALGKYLMTGSFAYAAVYRIFVDLMERIKYEYDASGIVPTSWSEDADTVTFDWIDDQIELITFKPEQVVAKLGTATHYEQYFNILPERWECDKVTVYGIKHRLISYNGVTMRVGAATTVRYTNIQYLMRHMLACAFMSDGKRRTSYFRYYISLQSMIAEFGKAFGETDHGIKIEKSSDDLPLLPSIAVYGADNLSERGEVNMNQLMHALGKGSLWNMPRGYNAGKARENRTPHPFFDPDQLHMFRINGRVIEKD